MIRTPNVSVCVVAKNGAHTTGPLFDSLREFADRRGDMVLVDTGSTDNTQTIYKAFGFRVFEVGDKFKITIPDDVVEAINTEAEALGDKPIIERGASLFNFSAARNYAASLALNDYIINPDADEAITVFDIDRVEKAFQAISRFRYDFVFSHKPDGSPDVFFVTDTRASDRRYWKWAGHIHETNAAISDKATMAYVPPDVFKVEHWQVPSPTRKSYLPGLAYACHIEPENDRNLHYYGRELLYLGFFRMAIAKLEKHLTISNWAMEKGQSLIFMGDAYRALGERAKAIESWHRAVEMDPTRREAWMRLADIYFKEQNPHAVLSCASAALALPMVVFYGNRPDNYTSLPHHYLYWAYQRIGNTDEARKHWMMALSYDPESKAFQYDAKYFMRAPGQGE